MTNAITNKTLSIVILFLAVFLFGYAGQAQTLGSLYTHGSSEQLYIEEGASLKSALEKLEQHYNVGLLYRSSIVERVTVRQSAYLSLNIEEALSFLLNGTDLRFKSLNPKTYGIYKNAVFNPHVLEAEIQQTVTGTVVDAQTGEALPGVNVFIDGTTSGTSTNLEGEFELSVASLDVTLIFSYIGYERMVVEIAGRTELNIQLMPDIQMLDDIVVVGYGRQERINLTGAVDQVTSETLDNRPIQNLTQGLQGVLPNVNINMIEGKPIHSPEINIRGATSIGQGGSALVLIDGVEGDISMLNPNDIESISVLKDASAAAVYGARGAFGVVLITTKRPVQDQLSVTYSGSMSYISLQLIKASM